MLNIRNIAVIAHVDHGKTTLIDAMLKQSHIFRENEDEMTQDCILDSNELERERGITILAKNVSIEYQGTKINIIDTPGHADFSGEVERTLNMADGALLIVDAQEGPMPQTRFVLKKALELNLKIIVVINKIDKSFVNIPRAIAKVGNLFIDLATSDSQLDFPILYAVGRTGKVFNDIPTDFTAEGNVLPLLNCIITHIPAPDNTTDGPFKMLVTSLDYNNHTGKIVIGKIHQGTIKPKQRVIIAPDTGSSATVETVMLSTGLGRTAVSEASAGDIVALTGISGVNIGQTLSDPSDLTALPTIHLSDPTLHMAIGPNTSPFTGREGKFSTARQIEERLTRELETNLSLRLERLSTGHFKISGRGELHLAVLLETLRREGYEMEVSKPEVIFKEIDGVTKEPVEEVSIIVPKDYLGVITQEMGKRLGKLLKMEPITDSEVEFIYHMPTRNIIGLRSILLTATKGTTIFNSVVYGYQEVGPTLPKLRKGVIIAGETGPALAYGMQTAQGRGQTFIEPGTQIYEGMIVGLNAKDEDIEINVTKGKKLTNMRSKSSDGVIQLEPATILSLEQSLDFLEADELLEITPTSLRLRKKFLTEIERRRHRRS